MTPDAIDVFKLPHVPLHMRSDLPPVAAIYFVLQSGSILYIGKAKSLQTRWSIHHRWIQFSAMRGCRIAWLEVSDAGILDGVERACIEHFAPKLNGRRILGNGYDLELDWRQMVRLPKQWGEEIEQLARKEAMPVAGALRYIIRRGLDDIKRANGDEHDGKREGPP